MKITYKAIAYTLLAVVMASCRTYDSVDSPKLTTSPTSTPLLEFAPELTTTPSPLYFDIKPSSTQEVYVPKSSTPTIFAFDQGLIWKECVIPDRDYYYGTQDIEELTRCFEIPEWDIDDPLSRGERIMGKNGSDLRLVIGDDAYEVKHDSSEGCCDYELHKNGEVIISISAPLITFDPNRNLFNIGGKLAWELISEPPVIFYDGENLNEKLDLEGSYFPYEIKGKLIFIAKVDDRYKIFYDNEALGPGFDEISMAYCCGNRSVIYGYGQYWFIGKREGIRYVVLIQ